MIEVILIPGNSKDSMDGKHFVETAKRDSLLVDALNSAIFAMALTHGASVEMEGVTGRLNFAREISKLRHALFLLGVDTSEPLSTRRRGRERR